MNSLDLDSALVPVEIFQFSDLQKDSRKTHSQTYESRFLKIFRGHNIRPKKFLDFWAKVRRLLT